jgi:hypothetical protein
MSVPSAAYYREYHGHRVEHLAAVHARLGARPRVFLAGDSSLDSKFYQQEGPHPPVNGYEAILSPPRCRRDVCYWLNVELGPERAVINCAVEESTVGERQGDLMPQDVFIRDNIGPDDILVVSVRVSPPSDLPGDASQRGRPAVDSDRPRCIAQVGGNDVALRPTLGTAWNMLKAVYLNSARSIEANPAGARGMAHFQSLFRDATKLYAEKLVSRQRPRKIVICMIYFPDEDASAPSWSDGTLGVLGYNCRPEKLQSLIRGAFECATRRITIAGCEVIPCPLFTAMDGKDSEMYVARVEPSEKGASAIARLIASCIAGGS